MNKQLYILRHAKSDMLQGVDDKDRPLTNEGLCQARDLAEKMGEQGYKPDFILCSPAKRTRQTCAAIIEKWPDIPVIYEDSLYLASTGQFYEILKKLDGEYEKVLLVGHNPGVHGLVQFLAGSGAPEFMEEIRYGYKAGSLSVILCDCESWGALMPDENKLDDLLISEKLARSG